jgi:hypothetical protein
MHLPHVNYLAVLVAGVAIFILGGLWYSPMLFSKKWIALQGKTDEQMKAEAAGKNMPFLFIQAFVCGLLVAFVMAIVVRHFPPITPMKGMLVGIACWLGFAGATSYANVVFSNKPLALWMIDSGYNLVSFIIAGAILGAWR